MRKSYIFSMAIVLIALVGMMIAADMALKPMKAALAIGSDLTTMLEARGDIAPESKVLVIPRAAGEKDLATEGFGIVIELTPSDAVRSRNGRLEKLARRSIREASRLYERARGRSPAWYEIRFMDGERIGHRVLFPIGPSGEIGSPAPAIPPVWVASARPARPAAR